MRIIIVGAGIAGLSTYLFLRKHLLQNHPGDYSIQIYEAYDVRSMRYDAPKGEAPQDSISEPLFSPKIIGNAIGISKNGLSVLSRIDDDGETVEKFWRFGSSVSKWRIGTARGWKIVDASVRSSVKSKDNDKTQDTDTVMIARQVAWEILRDLTLSIDRDAVAKRRVSGIETLASGRVCVQFADGSKDTADLLIGADGLRSIVRRTMFEDTNDRMPGKWVDWLMKREPKKKDYVTPHYEGLTGLGGFVPRSVLENTEFEEGTMAITFGPNGFFGHGYIGPVHQLADNSQVGGGENLASWWSTFSSDVPKPYEKEVKDESDSGSGVRTSFDRQSALQDLLKRHKQWSVPEIQAILNYLEKHEAIEHIYPTYTSPELPTWAQGSNMVLVGDAAHALQPSSGQGACQALEDAEALALFLAHYLHSAKHSTKQASDNAAGHTAKVSEALSKYVDFRRPRVHKIYVVSQRMSRSKLDMNVVQEYIMYFAVWLATKLNLQKAQNEELFEYDLPAEVKKAIKLETV